MGFEKIGSARAVPGKITSGKLQLGTFKGKKVSVPVFIAAGIKEGPTAFISGGVNGNELNGVQLCQNVLAHTNPNTLEGTIAFFPVMNPSGFKAGKRNVVFDDRDLNRAFVKNPKSISEKMAKTFLNEVVSIVDFGIDCHDSGEKNVLLPHSRVHYNKNKKCVGGCTLNLGRFFGSELIVERSAKKGMLAMAAKEEFDTPVMTIELGGGYTIWNKFQKEGVRGIQNILKFYGMLEGNIILPKKQFLIPINSRDFLFSKEKGIVLTSAKLGNIVHSGQEIARVQNPHTQKIGVIKSPKCGIIFSLQHTGKMLEENAIASVLGMSYCSIHKKRFSQVKAISNKKSSSVSIIKNKYLKEGFFG